MYLRDAGIASVISVPVTCPDGSIATSSDACPGAASTPSSTWSKVYGALAIASAVASGYHGVRRHNGSVLWGLLWFGLGGLFPVVTPTVAFAQGFAKPERK